jgi:thiamine-phosphate pyrophosphorylase
VSLPRLHLVTDDGVIASPGFLDRAAATLAAHGDAVALHLRGHATPGGALFRLAEALAAGASRAGAVLLVNDRVDVALAVGCGAQLGRRSLPLDRVRALLGPGAVIGYSAHDPDTAGAAVKASPDLVLAGTIWPSASHAGREAVGIRGLAAMLVAVDAAAPVVAIGGVTPARAREARAVGAHGVAVVSGVWAREDPVAAAADYLEAMARA